MEDTAIVVENMYDTDDATTIMQKLYTIPLNGTEIDITVEYIEGTNEDIVNETMAIVESLEVLQTDFVDLKQP